MIKGFNVDKYKEIYNEKILPNKSVTQSTIQTYNNDLVIYNEFKSSRQRANNFVLGGGNFGEKNKK